MQHHAWKFNSLSDHMPEYNALKDPYCTVAHTKGFLTHCKKTLAREVADIEDKKQYNTVPGQSDAIDHGMRRPKTATTTQIKLITASDPTGPQTPWFTRPLSARSAAHSRRPTQPSEDEAPWDLCENGSSPSREVTPPPDPYLDGNPTSREEMRALLGAWRDVERHVEAQWREVGFYGHIVSHVRAEMTEEERKAKLHHLIQLKEEQKVAKALLRLQQRDEMVQRRKERLLKAEAAKEAGDDALSCSQRKQIRDDKGKGANVPRPPPKRTGSAATAPAAKRAPPQPVRSAPAEAKRSEPVQAAPAVKRDVPVKQAPKPKTSATSPPAASAAAPTVAVPAAKAVPAATAKTGPTPAKATRTGPADAAKDSNAAKETTPKKVTPRTTSENAPVVAAKQSKPTAKNAPSTSSPKVATKPSVPDATTTTAVAPSTASPKKPNVASPPKPTAVKGPTKSVVSTKDEPKSPKNAAERTPTKVATPTTKVATPTAKVANPPPVTAPEPPSVAPAPAPAPAPVPAPTAEPVEDEYEEEFEEPESPEAPPAPVATTRPPEPEAKAAEEGEAAYEEEDFEAESPLKPPATQRESSPAPSDSVEGVRKASTAVSDPYSVDEAPSGKEEDPYNSDFSSVHLGNTSSQNNLHSAKKSDGGEYYSDEFEEN